VKGNQWFSLIDKVYSPKNLEAAYVKVAKNKGAAGVDRVSVPDVNVEDGQMQETRSDGQLHILLESGFTH
ncbi:MAG: hypothetical protein ACM31E_01270, partial [Fibrobacterota bacterium]